MKICKEIDCGRKHYVHGLCRRHWGYIERSQPRQTCIESDCSKKQFAGGLCSMHYYRIHANGDTNTRFRKANGEGSLRKGYKVFTSKGRRKQEGVLVVEKILNKELPKKAVVHHVNENKSDNRPSNLVVCQSQGYHRTIHARLNAFKACGNVHWRPCSFCHQYDSPLSLVKNGTSHYHRSCAKGYNHNRRKKNESLQSPSL